METNFYGKMRKGLKKGIALVTILSMVVLAFIFPAESAEAATLLSNRQSSVGSPYAIYTFTATASNRTSTTVSITATVTANLRSSTSSLGTGKGLVAGIYIGGSWHTWTLKTTSASWTGTTKHSASTTFTVSGLSNSQTSLSGIYVRVARSDTTGTACVLNQVSVGSLAISANTSYAVSYDANGGSGAPSNQTKWSGVSLTLSSTIPTRPGYTFLGWNTSSTATSANYSPGATYTTNAALKLYAVWRSDSCTPFLKITS